MYIRKNASFDPTLHGLIERERMTTVEAAPGQAPDPAYEPACFEQETGLSACLAAEWLARLNPISSGRFRDRRKRTTMVWKASRQ